ncbi:MAG: glycosyltransferase family 39 protein, partial [Candidatus Woesearchaeota archaeon]|nr:glycosyltransferase family 39 protein [Candidatus Woesearchaeota archaeon]
MKRKFQYEIILILVLLVLAAVPRLYASTLPVTDGWAKTNLGAYYSRTNRSSLVGTPTYNNELKQLSGLYKDMFRDKDSNYLYGYDSYLYLIKARDIVDGNGYDGSSEKFIPYLEAYFFKSLKLFNKDISLIKAVFWLPFIFSLLSVALIFFIGKKLAGVPGGFVAGLLLALNPHFFSYTLPGFADNYFINTFFTLLIVLFFFEVIDIKDAKCPIKKRVWKNKTQIISLTMLILCFAVFKFTWNGWYYLFFLIMLYCTLYILYFLFKLKDSKRKVCIIIALVSVILIAVSGFLLADFVVSKLNPVPLNILKTQLGMRSETIFPSSASSTSELLSVPEAQKLKGSSQNPVIFMLGSWVMAVLLLISLFFMLKDKKTKQSMFVLLWFAAMFIVAYVSNKFLLFFILPMCLAASYGLARSYEQLRLRLKRSRLNKRYLKLLPFIALVLAIMFFWILFSKDIISNSNQTPYMTSIMEQAGNSLIQTNKNSSIYDWWTNGYFYSYYSEHKVFIHNGYGGSSDPRLYWMAREFMSTDEDEAVQILFNYTQLYSPLNGNIPLEHNYTMPDVYIIVDPDMMKSVDIMRYFAGWNFSQTHHEQYKRPERFSVTTPVDCEQQGEPELLACQGGFT